MIDFFTKQEKVCIVFLLFGLIIGSSVELYHSHFKPDLDLSENERLDEFERDIHNKAALIDSIISNKKLSTEEDNHSQILNELPAENDTHGIKTQQKLLLDINTATVGELIQLPGVGPVSANRIVEYRSTYGPFKTIEELIKVKGIGEKKLNNIKPYIYIKSK